MLETLKRIPLVKGALKETLRLKKKKKKMECFTCYSLGHKHTISTPRLHPVAVSLQRYIAEDIIIQNYHIPAGVSSESKP